MIRFIVCFLSFLMFAANLYAGVVITMNSKDLKSGKETTATRIHAQGGMTRTDSVQQGKETTMIFRDNAMWIIDHKEKRYHVMDQQTIEKMSGQLNTAMKQMEEQLAKLPPDQRQMMEKMMKGQMEKMGGAMGDMTMRVEPLGAGSFQNYSCKNYAIYLGKQKLQETCAAPVDQIEGSDELMASFNAMADFSKKLMESLQNVPFVGAIRTNAFAAVKEMDGVPVKTTHFENNQAVREETLQSAEKKDLDASLFTPPAGYKKVDIYKQQ